jgi:NADP-dependent 3-hydroxy acid dehydrogenase YdfG
MKILITGATSGIGEATARLCLKNGHSLILTGRRENRLLALQAEFGAQRCQIACFDIRNQSELSKFVGDFGTSLQDLDVLINNAGLAKGVEKVQEAKLSDWQEMIDTNVSSVLAITHAILPFMVARKKGHIVNLGSVAGRWTYPGGAVYCASKFAIRAFSEGLRLDLLGKNIRVTNIEPGMVNTEFSLVRMGTQEKADAVYQDMVPLTANDIAETIVWTLERPKHVNIQELVIYPTDQAAVGQVHRESRS